MVALPTLFSTPVPHAVSDDGSHVYGIADKGDLWQAWVWDSQNGMRDLASVLGGELNFDVNGWKLFDVTSVSADGRVLVGWGMTPFGQWATWVATIPEPTSIGSLIFIFSVLARRRVRP